MKFVEWLKWGGTGFVLSGILLTNLNLYRSILWCMAPARWAGCWRYYHQRPRADGQFRHANAAFRAWLCENGWADLALNHCTVARIDAKSV